MPSDGPAFAALGGPWPRPLVSAPLSPMLAQPLLYPLPMASPFPLFLFFTVCVSYFF